MKQPIAVAFSGGLDTSFLVAWFADQGHPVTAISVNTGAWEDTVALAAHARTLGAAEHVTLDGRPALFDDHIAWLIRGNVLRGRVYPLCVGVERVVQAKVFAAEAAARGIRILVHGSTAAGNDQVRFDVALQVVGDELEILAPIRSLGLSREESTAYLEDRGFSVPADTTDYSINRGLWGTTVGGKETLTTEEPLPEAAYPDTVPPTEAPDTPQELTITFEDGLPTALDDEPMESVALVEALNEIGGSHGVGRDIHVGDTILGIKGRIGFEAPAAQILITAHRELEKVVLSKWQQVQKEELGSFYGRLLHEGQYFDPVMRDVEAFLDHTQDVVSGTVTVKLFKGRAQVQGVYSPHSMFDASTATYGEENALWDGRDAEGFTKLAAVPSLLAKKARSTTAPTESSSPTPATS